MWSLLVFLGGYLVGWFFDLSLPESIGIAIMAMWLTQDFKLVLGLGNDKI